MRYHPLLLLLLLLLTACVTDEPAVTPTADTPLAATAPASDAPTSASPVEADAVVVYGRTDEGAFFHGAPDAPVTLIDYSDFL